MIAVAPVEPGTTGFTLEFRGVRHRVAFGCLRPPVLSGDELSAAARYWLHPSELERFGQLRLPRRQSSFVFGRMVAKAQLSQFGAGSDPRRSLIEAGVFGQPVLCHPGETPLWVTLSHTDGLVAAVVSPAGVPFGVDVEQIVADRLPSLRQALATDLARFGSARGQLSEVEFAFALWTQKESVGKATHIGLTSPMATYDLASLSWPSPDLMHAEFANLSQFACQTRCLPDHAVSLSYPRLGELDIDLDRLLAEMYGAAAWA